MRGSPHRSKRETRKSNVIQKTGKSAKGKFAILLQKAYFCWEKPAKAHLFILKTEFGLVLIKA